MTDGPVVRKGRVNGRTAFSQRGQGIIICNNKEEEKEDHEQTL